MTDFKNMHDKPGNPQKDEMLDSLFQHASRRPRAPAEVEAAIRAATYTEWQKVSRQRKHRRYLAGFAVAASIILAVTLVVSLQKPAPSPVATDQLAQLDAQSGEVFVHDLRDDDSTAHLLKNNTLFAGQVISTNAGARLALAWNSGESIRLDENSKLALLSVSEIELISGRVYIDTHHATGTGRSFVIQTVAGPIRHVGTQYLAGIEGQTVILAVREGEVLLGAGKSDIRIQKGELASVGPSGRPDIRPIEVFGTMWEWTSLVTPELILDGMSAFDLIRWAGRETGHEVEFIDAATQDLAMETDLRGRVSLTPERALELVLQTSDIEAVSVDGRILVRMRTRL